MRFAHPRQTSFQPSLLSGADKILRPTKINLQVRVVVYIDRAASELSRAAARRRLVPESASAYFHFSCAGFAKVIKDPFQ